MVTITFRLSDSQPVVLSLDSAESLKKVLQYAAKEAGIELGGVIVVRDGKILKDDDQVGVDDCIDVFPAISGG